MKGFLGLCLLVAIATLLSMSQSLAQSGVLSGPPQVRPSGPGAGPGPGPGLGPGPYGPGPGRPGQGPGAGPGPSPGPYGPGPGPTPGPRGPGPGPSLAPPGPQDGQGLSWIAVVAGFDGTGKKVSVGYSGPQRSKFEAEDAAIRACNRVDGKVYCQNPFAVSTGCLYIVPGNKRGGGVRWGRGGTPDAAFAECRRGGYVCPRDKLIGGCVPGIR
jgi:hypothetical protein